MALTTRAPGQSPIDSSAINQFVQALTGVMSDQPFTLANTLTVTNTITGSSQATFTNLLTASSGLTVGGTLTASSNLNVTQTITASSLVTITGTLTSSTINSSGIITTTSALSMNMGASSSQLTVMQFGMGSSSTYKRPGLYVGSSFPSIVGPAPGSLFFLMGGTSSNSLLIALPNGGSGSSSNWAQFTSLSSAQ